MYVCNTCANIYVCMYVCMHVYMYIPKVQHSWNAIYHAIIHYHSALCLYKYTRVSVCVHVAFGHLQCNVDREISMHSFAQNHIIHTHTQTHTHTHTHKDHTSMITWMIISIVPSIETFVQKHMHSLRHTHPDKHIHKYMHYYLYELQPSPQLIH
jgi:hypothetical protein